MDTAQSHRHAAHFDRQRIAATEYAGIGKRDPRALINTQRPQALRFFGNENGPVDCNDSRRLAKGKLIECHANCAATAQRFLQSIRNNFPIPTLVNLPFAYERRSLPPLIPVNQVNFKWLDSAVVPADGSC